MYGMMWLDENPKKSLETKVKEGKQYFENKYGVGALEYCYVKGVEEQVIEGLKVMSSQGVLKNHYYFVVKSELSKHKLKLEKVKNENE